MEISFTKIGILFFKIEIFYVSKFHGHRRAFHPVIIITFKASFMSSSFSLQNLVYTVEAAGRKLLVIHLITGGCSVGFIYFIHFPFYSNPKVISSRVKISMRIFPITSLKLKLKTSSKIYMSRDKKSV